MSGSSNFLQFDSAKSNIIADDDYSASLYRIGGVTQGIAPSNIHNKMYYQVTSFVAAMAEALANKGYTVSDSSYSNLVTVLSNISVGSIYEEIIFQNAATTIGNGASLTVNDYNVLTVGIHDDGSGSTVTVEFHGVDSAGNDNLIVGTKLSDSTTGTSTSAVGETWQFTNIAGLSTVYFKITAISGTITIKGKAVASQMASDTNEVITITFQNAVTAIGNGNSLTVDNLKNLTLGVHDDGSSSTVTVQFRGVDAAGNDTLQMGVRKNDFETASSTSTTGETWQFDISGLVTFYCKITAISGTITIAGEAVV